MGPTGAYGLLTLFVVLQQLFIVELLLCILFFSILREEYASFGREQILGLVAELQLPPPRQYFFWSRLSCGTISMMHAT